MSQSNTLFWLARYQDGSCRHQHENGADVCFDDVSREGLRDLILADVNGNTVLHLEVKPGQMVFYRRRTIMIPGKEQEVMHILGHKIIHSGELILYPIFVYESDLRIEVGDFREKPKKPDEKRHAISFHPADDTPVT
jgi:hypothetical protein